MANLNGWPMLNSEQRKAKIERRLQVIALQLMAEDMALDKATALAKAQQLFGRGKTYPRENSDGR